MRDAEPIRDTDPGSGDTLEHLREQLADAEDLAWEMERRLRETLASTSYRLGQNLVSAIVRPSGLRRLPAQLWRLYRERGARGDLASEIKSRPERLLIPYRALERRGDAPLITVVGSRRVVRSLEASFEVVPLWPHDAGLIADVLSPDMVLVESGAFMPGEEWWGLGTPIGASLEASLLDALNRFQRQSVPIVFWWTTPEVDTPNVECIVCRSNLIACDRSVQDVPDGEPLSLGVQLEEIEPIDPMQRTNHRAPLLHLGPYESDPLVSPTNWLVASAVAAGGEVLYDPSHMHSPDQTLLRRDAASRYRRAGWTTPTTDCPSHRCLAMLASGVPVLVAKALGGFGNVVMEVVRQTDLLAAAEAGRERMSMPAAMAEVLRTVHLRGTTRSRFAGLFESLGVKNAKHLDDEIGVTVETPIDVESAVATLVEQSVRPAEVLVADAEIRERLVTTFGPLAIPVRAPTQAETRRHVLWRGERWHPTYLQDLLIASQVLATNRLSNGGEAVMTGTNGVELPLPWWVAGTSVD